MFRSNTLALFTFTLAATAGANDRASVFELPLEDLLNLKLEGDSVSHMDLHETPTTNNDFSLTNFALPKTVEVIDYENIQARGLKNVIEVVENMTGVISGESPSEPYSFSSRGFTRDSINVTYDGISMGMATYNTRPRSTFNIDRVELTKGPAELSVGQGAGGGNINIITKKARRTKHHIQDVLLSVGKFSTQSYNLGAEGPVSEELFYRVDASVVQSNGWVERSDSNSIDFASSALWSPSDALDVLFSASWQEDKLPAYWGTPFVPANMATSPIAGVLSDGNSLTIDEATRFINYNVQDNDISSNSYWLRADMHYDASSSLGFEATIYRFFAQRNWQNAENYFFNPTLNMVERDRLLVEHDRDNLGLVLKMNTEHSWLGKDMRSTVQFSQHNIDFDRVVGFNLASRSLYWDDVDLFQPEAGEFGYVDRRFDSLKQKNTSMVVTSHSDVTDGLTLMGQLKYERIGFDRNYNNWNGTVRQRATIDKNYSKFSYLLGVTHKMSDNVHGYAHYVKTQDPIFADYRFTYDVKNLELSDVTQFEIGAKAIVGEGDTEISFAAYRASKSVVTQPGQGQALFDSQLNSKGLDISVASKLSSQMSLAVNIALTRARYNTYYDPEIGVQVDGNTPVNVPKLTANAALSYLFDAKPVEIGLKINYVDGRWANSVNTVEMESYTTANIFAGYHGKKYHLGLHINNVFDEIYAPWSDIYYPNQVILGPPRTIELTYKVKF